MDGKGLSLILPTLGRVDCLNRFLESIKRQGVLPAELIIVDAGRDDLSDSLTDFNSINIRYLRTAVPSLTKQKNIGIAHLAQTTDLVGFIDDDIVLRDGSLKHMVDFWQTAGPDVGGASFNAVNNCFTKANVIDRIFCLGSARGGQFLRSGFNTQISSIDSTRRVDWLFGGITVWRRRVVEEFKFDEWFTGNAFCDDIDYSYRAGKKYKMMVVKEAEVLHLGRQLPPEKEYQAARAQAQNRVYFVKKHKDFSLFLCYWAHIGLCLKNLLSAVSTGKPHYLSRTAGIFAGIFTPCQDHERVTVERYSFLWSRQPASQPKMRHFDAMQRVITDRIVRQGIGLDLGCGAGHDTFFMARDNPATLIIGMDISEGVYTAARLNRGLKNAVIIRGSASDIPLKDESLDFVYSFGVLHHMVDYKKGLAEIYRLLKKQGPVFLYLYEDHSDSPLKGPGIKIVSGLRRVTVKVPTGVLYLFVSLLSPLAVAMFSYPANIFKRHKATYKLYERWPFNFGTSLFSLRGDLFDRFSAPVEHRFSRDGLHSLLREHNFNNIKTAKLEATAGWVVWAYKAGRCAC